MKAFHYSLASLLNVRRLQQEQREAELAAALQRRQAAQHQLELLDQELQQAYNQKPAAVLLSAQYFMQRERYLYALKKQRRNQQQLVAEAETNLSECRDRLRDAVMEVRKLEKHRDTESQRWLGEFRREENRINDEIGLNLNLRKREALSHEF